MNDNKIILDRSALLSILIPVLDFLVISISTMVSFWLKFDSTAPNLDYQFAMILGTVLVIFVFSNMDLYRIGKGLSKFEEPGQIMLGITISFLVLALISVLTKTTISYSREWFITWYVSLLVFINVSRWSLRVFVNYFQRRKGGLTPVLLIGSKKQLTLMEGAILSTSGMEFITATRYELVPAAVNFPQLLNVIETSNCDQIWISMPIHQASLLESLISEISTNFAKEIRYVPDIFGMDLINRTVSHVGGLPIVNLSVSPLQGRRKAVKWLEDKLLSLVILLLISPLLLAIAIGVKLSSPGPVLFRQERVSWNGKRFFMLKFRSMPADIEQDGVKWGGASEKVNSKFGKFIRVTSVDELPQFINVLMGDMSVVGPRPERTVFVEKFKTEIPQYMQKHKVKAGITGWAQINGLRGDTDLNERVEHDLFYIENWSLWLDIKIIFLTIFKGLFHKNAR